jgi:glycosyltransferase involved in cell wall biosynthesis
LPKIAALAEDARAWKADHIHAAFAGHPATAAWIIGRLTGIPYSVSCHAHDIFASQALLDRKLAEAAFVRTISDFNRGFLLAKVAGLQPDRIKIIRCGMDLATLPPLPPPSNHEGLRILFVGRLVPQKGLDVLLEALADPAANPDWRLEVIGDGPDAGSLREQASAAGLGQRVNWRGNCRFEEVARAYSETDVVVSPSVIGPNGRTEGIPNVLMEALACTRPVIATRLTGVPELVIDGETGLLVPPADPAALVAALRTVEANPEAAARMAASGRRIVERHYDLRRTAAAQYASFEACRPMVGQIPHPVASRLPESIVD